MARLSHHGVLLLLLLLHGLSAARAADGDDGVQTNRSLSISARDGKAPAAQQAEAERTRPDSSSNAPAEAEQGGSPSAGEQDTSSSDSTASPQTPSPRSTPSSDSSAEKRPASERTASPGVQDALAPDGSTLPARERLPLGPTDATEGDREKLADGSSDQSWMLQTLAALGVVIGLILLVRAVLQRLGGGQAGPAGKGLVEVMARSSIGPRTQVLFLRINQRVVVVAQSSSGLQTLTELSDPEDVAWLLGQVESSKPMSISRGFQHLMQRAERDYNRAEMAGAEDGTDEQEQYVDRTRSQLSGLLNHIRTLKQRAP